MGDGFGLYGIACVAVGFGETVYSFDDMQQVFYALLLECFRFVRCGGTAACTVAVQYGITVNECLGVVVYDGVELLVLVKGSGRECNAFFYCQLALEKEDA